MFINATVGLKKKTVGAGGSLQEWMAMPTGKLPNSGKTG